MWYMQAVLSFHQLPAKAAGLTEELLSEQAGEKKRTPVPQAYITRRHIFRKQRLFAVTQLHL